MAKLVLKFKDKVLEEYGLQQPALLIGRRESNDIKIDNLAVSGNHAKIQSINGSYVIVDLKSTNGVLVNGKKVLQAKLHNLDEITIGKHTLIFEEEGQPSAEIQERQQEAADTTVDHGNGSEEEESVEEGPIAQIHYFDHPEHSPVDLHKKLTIIGRRDDADIRLKGPFGPKVSSYINRKPSGYSILPEERARIKVNGEPVTQQQRLSHGDIIEVGALRLQFKDPPQAG
jgi:pSer/pThr/pTyr-binding forkhead associated (FHA) protein